MSTKKLAEVGGLAGLRARVDPNDATLFRLEVVATADDGTALTGLPITGLPAGENHVGEVGGAGVTVSPTITLAGSPPPAYSASDIVGGKLTLSNALRVSNGRAYLVDLLIVDLDNLKAAFDILIFNANPNGAGGAYTDNAGLTLGTGDGTKVCRRIAVAASDYVSVGGIGVAEIAIGKYITGANANRDLYAVIVTSGTPTYTANGQLIARFGFIQD